MADLKAKEITLVDVNELSHYDKNTNNHPESQINYLCKLIEYQGFRNPLIVQKGTNIVVAGNGRLVAAKKLGMTHVPVSYQEFDNEAQMFAYMVSDNKISEQAVHDDQKMFDEIKLLPDLNLEMLGIQDFKLPEIFEPQADEDSVPEFVEPNTKLGDVYKLGNHRLMCGDSTNIDSIAALMNGNRAAITFTSPPYNAGKFQVTGKAMIGKSAQRDNKYLTVKDDMSSEDYEDFLSDILSGYLQFSDSVMLNLGMLEDGKRSIIKLLARFVDQFKDTIYWRKQTSTPHIQPGIMTCLVEPIFCFGNHNTRQFKSATFKGNFGNIIEGANASGNEFAKIHSATFPVYLPEGIIENFTSVGGGVIDCFGGTGTTMIACEKTNRKCFMMELDPHYCDVIVERWEKYTGKKAELIGESAAKT